MKVSNELGNFASLEWGYRYRRTMVPKVRKKHRDFNIFLTDFYLLYNKKTLPELWQTEGPAIWGLSDGPLEYDISGS